ncbi:MLP protein [Melia azedarach]|uniref:MLP protein n=1 Tax=Melia azedarach TaxID=155640 RepID=A0ACC1XF97_MELAZ|nr:MLP protein [Melia azedarach]
MSLVGQLETVVEVKTSAAQLHEVFSCMPYIVTITSPERVQSCELIQGEWGKEGSVICWRLTRALFCCRTVLLSDGSDPQISKEIMEVIDNENSITIYKLIEGRMLETYKNFFSIAKISPKDDDEGSLVYWTYKYEKHNEDAPDLDDKLIHMATNVIKNIDAYLVAQLQA